MGVEFQLNTEIGNDLPVTDLLRDYDALFIGTGTYTALGANLENEQCEGVYDALDYLIANTDHLMNGKRSQYPDVDLEGKRVVVLGGGDTAMDCLRTAIRQGVSDVACVYRRDRENMPGSAREVQNGEDEGVRFLWNLQPLAVSVDENGKVRGRKVVSTRLGEPDEHGRRRPEVVSGTEAELSADAIVMAFGFRASPPQWLADINVGLNEWQLINASTDTEFRFQTSNEKVFAGGDVVRGSDLVVTAIAEGRQAAESILRYLGV